MTSGGAPGWYTPKGQPSSRQCYYDGHEWTDDWRDRASGELVVAGYVCAVLFAIVGFVIGIVLMVKNRAGHGVLVCIVSVLVMAYAVDHYLITDSSPEPCVVDGQPVLC